MSKTRNERIRNCYRIRLFLINRCAEKKFAREFPHSVAFATAEDVHACELFTAEASLKPISIQRKARALRCMETRL